MKLHHRRQFLHLAAGAAALPAVLRNSWAQAYPTRPVRIIVGFAAGGGADIAARLIGQWLSDRLGQSFVVENRSGAGSNIGTETVLNALPDGYTLLLATLSNAVNTTLYTQFPLYPRHNTNRGHHPRAACHSGASISSGQDCPRVHRLCQSESGKSEHGNGRQWKFGPHGGRTVQCHGWHQDGPHSLSRPRSSL